MSSSKPKTYEQSYSIPAFQDTLWLINSGIVRTSTSTEKGRVTALGYWGVKDIVGQPLCTLNSLRIECITEVEAVPLSRDEWPQYLPAALQHSQRTTELISYVINENVTQRLVHILGWLGSRFGVPFKDGTLIDLPLTHSAIAELIGSTRVTVTRILGQMANESVLVQYKNGRLLLLKDMNSLTVEFINVQLSWNKRAMDRI
jgi:CRP-like cAMP-binding protein